MNAVEIEEAISNLAREPFNAAEFPFQFLTAFGNKETTVNRLRKGDSNASDLPGGVLQRNNIHISVCETGRVSATLKLLRESPRTASAKAKFILATDGVTLEAEETSTGDPIASEFQEFPKHFGFFLPLAGISTVKEIKNNPIDVRATGRLNKLYVELLKGDPEWATAARRHDMNHFMARLIFCFFAEDTGIFNGEGLFTKTIDRMSAADSSNTHDVLSTLFRAMNTERSKRESEKIPTWADGFPYVNGGLFSGSTDVPHFTKMARNYLLNAGRLSWREINPDIFGSMIQAVADDEERGTLGMHYTSVPNILKVLNPLFLDDLHSQLTAAGDNARALLNLRKRMSKIRVFDPACGSGNFLVIAYKEMRAIEAEINQRRGEPHARTEIKLTNFRGIELRDFPAEIARLALIIAEYQSDVKYRGQKEALAEFLPLDAMNWITCGNALQLDWLSIWPSTGTTVKIVADDFFTAPIEQAEIDFENEGGETYICGNPPYLGSTWQTDEQKQHLQAVFDGRTKGWKSLDYVAGWFMKAADYGTKTNAATAFVATNSICQGQQVPILWPLIFGSGHEIFFAHTSFKWANLASHNAGVIVVIIGISNHPSKARYLYTPNDEAEIVSKEVNNINAYLISGPNIVVDKGRLPDLQLSQMIFGNKSVDGGHLLLSSDEADGLRLNPDQRSRMLRRIYGSAEFIRGLVRYCLWIEDNDLPEAMSIEPIRQRIANVRSTRLASPDSGANEMANRPHQMREMNIGNRWTITVPRTSSENRPYLPVGLIDQRSTVTSEAFAMLDAPIWNLAIVASRLHLLWIATVCGKLKNDFRYSNTMGWNTFPMPRLTDQNKSDLTARAENILVTREAHFPATIAELYEPNAMPDDLLHAHEQNDEVIERIYIGRRFRNDTERLEKLFEMYAKTAAAKSSGPKTRKAA
ncbi:lactate dehydrogenase [Betaproteobacteria bacterium UKL13-2]|nr:lactate dehydrogenase [Betaproteobacteria bacterium UKL13-2]HCG52512.1 lactate dehydrogenase [Betaproteobacteria bacterium]